mmetsp:Transcript_9962/g.19219  ORF Transcript_9962/g.19219 Transcript_9962/m.19219 type:complete len:125 (-) Transcript_9962:33-407(-)
MDAFGSSGGSFLLTLAGEVALTSFTASRDSSSSDGTRKTAVVEPKRQSSACELPNKACSEHEKGVVVVTEAPRRSASANNNNKEAIEAKKKILQNLDIMFLCVWMMVMTGSKLWQGCYKERELC